MPTEELKKVLLDSQTVSLVDFENAQSIADKEKVSIEKVLVKEKIISEIELGQIIAKHLGFPFVDLNHESIQDNYLSYMPESVAISQQALIFSEDETTFKIATTNPTNYELAKNLEKIVGKKSQMYYATPTSIEKFLLFYKNNLPQDFRDFVEDFKKTANDEIIVKMVNRVVSYAYENKASDIHIEPSVSDVGIRVRVDGLLRRVATYPLELHPKIVFLIKIKSHLKTDEHGMTQDGRFSHSVGKEKFDIRVSILPVTNGENIVMRILSEKSRRLTLEELGLMPEDLEKIKKIVSRPNGMIISTGATGSGKTTTLYAILQLVDKKKLNVVTIEDPVEYAMEGIQQIQVNEKKNLNFANGLRSIVRQDPDMIMVGEIRDDETASIAINAALTGHVLFTTLHSNDTATVFSRLSELNVEKTLIATSVSVIISQRLVRKVCPYCKVSRNATESETAFIKANPNLESVLKNEFKDKMIDPNNIHFYSGAGCAMCGNTGFLGRTGIFEVLEMNDEIRKMVVAGEISQNIKKFAILQGMKTLEYWELYHLISGTTTLEELLNPIA
ncbi:MAG TPA: GspE/PulE family protein [Candidatus Paceibacterota bacterium]|nr:GspE/PulE family protein [Candidatus Paceibacterota bacterium]HMP18776.1 GspE/PulE family protein [Candidatus Paceibacterota bacterium]